MDEQSGAELAEDIRTRLRAPSGPGPGGAR